MAIWQTLLLISCGAALGASLRWWLGLLLNPLLAFLSLGTLAANFLGCFIIGILFAVCWQYPQFSQGWKLFLITGFLGSLTTFSSFSAEVVENLMSEEWLSALSVISLHVMGGICFTFLGMALWRVLVN